jgi:2-amino-4-hydroxy-6-hydroxymethyldihydropteridine diphosphokinase
LRNIIAFLGLGSNMGIQPADHCRKAIDLISKVPQIRVLRTSSLYRTEPVGFKEQDWFVNAAIEVRTALYPQDLLKALQSVEQTMGRVRKNTDRWGPRVMDIDILLYGQDIVEEEGLFIPHPELHRRRFALVPLAEIASYVIHPRFGVTVKALLERIEDQSKVIRL